MRLHNPSDMCKGLILDSCWDMLGSHTRVNVKVTMQNYTNRSHLM